MQVGKVWREKHGVIFQLVRQTPRRLGGGTSWCCRHAQAGKSGAVPWSCKPLPHRNVTTKVSCQASFPAEGFTSGLPTIGHAYAALVPMRHVARAHSSHRQGQGPLKTAEALVLEAHGLSTEARDLINMRRDLADVVRDYADHCHTQIHGTLPVLSPWAGEGVLGAAGTDLRTMNR